MQLIYSGASYSPEITVVLPVVKEGITCSKGGVTVACWTAGWSAVPPQFTPMWFLVGGLTDRQRNRHTQSGGEEDTRSFTAILKVIATLPNIY